MARIPYYDFGQASPELAEAMKDRPPLNMYRMIAHGGESAIRFLALGRSLMTASTLDPGLRELAILRVGTLCGATYEVLQHRKVAARLGVPADKVDAVTADPGRLVPADRFDHLEQAVLGFTDAVVRDVKAPAPLFREVAAGLSHQQLLELLMTIGFYMLAGRISENLEIDLEQ